MAQMICDICYKTFPGPGTLCPECVGIDGVESSRRLAALKSRLGEMATPDCSAQLVPASRSLRLLAALAETLFYLPFAVAAIYFAALFLEPGDLLLLERYIQNRGNGMPLLESSSLMRAMQVELGLSMLFVTLYLFAFEASPLQGSIGKLLIGLQVVDRRGNRPTFARILIRTASRWVLGLPVLAVFLGQYLWLITHHAPPGVLENYLSAGALITMLGACLTQLLDNGVALFSKHRQTLHDMLSDTYVVVEETPSVRRVLLCLAIAIVGNLISLVLSLS